MPKSRPHPDAVAAANLLGELADCVLLVVDALEQHGEPLFTSQLADTTTGRRAAAALAALQWRIIAEAERCVADSRRPRP